MIKQYVVSGVLLRKGKQNKIKDTIPKTERHKRRFEVLMPL